MNQAPTRAGIPEEPKRLPHHRRFAIAAVDASSRNETIMGRRQAVRQRILIPPCGGSNPPAPATAFRESGLPRFPAPEKRVVSEGFAGERFDWGQARQAEFGSLKGQSLRTVCLGGSSMAIEICCFSMG
jgi:hypothetical protein